MGILFIRLCFLPLFLAVATDDWTKKLESAKDGVDKIKVFMAGENKGMPFKRLAYVTDNCGSRLVGSECLEKASDILVRDSNRTSLDMKEEKVMVSSWQEESSSATLHSKFRTKRLSIVAYGPSVSGKHNATILLVKSFDELTTEAAGKIVVYNQECQDYEQCVQYRNDGASKAAEYGAVASLTRSVTPYANYNPHTGPVMYKDTKIPAAAITVEDAAFIERILKRDPNATIDLNINTVTDSDKESRNLIINIPGTDSKDEVLLFGTQIDSWHVGEGVSSAVGCNILYEAMRAIRKLNLKPKRTLKLVLWTAEEQDSKGEKQYMESVKDNDKIKLVMKIDKGDYNIRGLAINNNENLKNFVQAFFDTFFKEQNLRTYDSKATSFSNTSDGSDKSKVPTFELISDMERYLAIYNSGADTLDKYTPEEADRAATLFASFLYTLGTIDIDIS